MTTNTTPTPAAPVHEVARELAQLSREFLPMLLDSTPDDTETTRGHIANYVKDYAADIADTLDALVDENAKLREVLRQLKNYSYQYVQGYKAGSHTPVQFMRLDVMDENIAKARALLADATPSDALQTDS